MVSAFTLCLNMASWLKRPRKILKKQGLPTPRKVENVICLTSYHDQENGDKNHELTNGVYNLPFEQRVTMVSCGRAHTGETLCLSSWNVFLTTPAALLTAEGRVFTFGKANKGQVSLSMFLFFFCFFFLFFLGGGHAECKSAGNWRMSGGILRNPTAG